MTQQEAIPTESAKHTSEFKPQWQFASFGKIVLGLAFLAMLWIEGYRQQLPGYHYLTWILGIGIPLGVLAILEGAIRLKWLTFQYSMDCSSIPLLDTLQEVEELAKAFKLRDAEAIMLQQRYHTRALEAAFLAPLAVLLLTVQVLGFHDRSPWSIGLVATEAFCLARILYLAMDHASSSKAWMLMRLRAELLRREMFLVLARVGPYMDGSDLSAQVTIRQRMLAEHEASPVDMIPLCSIDRTHYRKRLHELKAPQFPASIPDLKSCFEIYFRLRVQFQLAWYKCKTEELAFKEELAMRLVKAVLVLALVVAVAHIFLLPETPLTDTKMHAGEGSAAVGHILVGLFAIALPPIGAAIEGVAALFEWRRLGRSYLYQRQELQHYEIQLIRLESLINQINTQTDPNVARSLQMDFQELVLDIEDHFAAELKQWIVLVRSDEVPVRV